MLNKVILQGRCGKDPEKRMTPSGVPVASVSLAVDRDFNKDGEKKTDWIDVIAWRGTANFLADYFHKGSTVIVVGRLEIREWVDKDGNKRRNAEVIADSVYFGDSKKSSEGTSSYQPTNTSQEYTGDFQKAMDLYTQATSAQSDFAMLEDDDASLPF